MADGSNRQGTTVAHANSNLTFPYRRIILCVKKIHASKHTATQSAHRILLVSLATLLVGCASTGHSPDLEESICGWPREPIVFALWNRLAGKADPGRANAVANAESITYRTRDGRVLRGYKLASTAADGVVAGKLLVAQGNAMLSDRLLSSLNGFTEAGLEVFIFDYRGYGNSEGKRRLKAIVSDYREMAARLTESDGGLRLLYGISFGGVVMLNVIGSGAEYDRAVIDSTPSRISGLGCPWQYDPAANLTSDASRILVLAGERDTVVPVRDSAELLARASELGARSELHSEYAHPFMDRDINIHRARLALIRSFLLESRANAPDGR